MIRLNILCEGPTEQTFVRDLLLPEYATRIDFRTILVGRKPGVAGGGNVKYSTVGPDLIRALKQDREAFCTTMLDYYGLGTDFPRKDTPNPATSSQKAEAIESAVHEDICNEMGTSFNTARLIPYIQMHEFESLLFSDPQAMAAGVSTSLPIPQLVAIRDSFSTPEDIDDGSQTAPSKRIIRLAPDYRKIVHGIGAAKKIGLGKMRDQCPHFHQWLTKIEALMPDDR